MASVYYKLSTRFNSQSSGARLNALRALINERQAPGEAIESFIARKANIMEHRLQGEVTKEEILLLSVVGGIAANHQQTIAALLTEPNVSVERVQNAITSLGSTLSGG